MSEDQEPEWVRRSLPPPTEGRRNLVVLPAGVAAPPIEPFPAQSYAELSVEDWQWLWLGRIPLGEVSYLEGYAGDGKSSVVADLAARVSSGAGMPGESEDAASIGGVVWFTTEESPTKTILRRLQLAGARLANIRNIDVAKIDADKRNLPRFQFPSGRARLSTSVAHYSKAMGLPIRLVVIDGVFSIFDHGRDANDGQDVREVLGALRGVAIEHNLAILCIRHPSKAKGGLAQHRAGGSTAWNDLVRMSWLVGQEPGTDWKSYQRVLVPVKQNAGRAVAGLKFSTEWDEAAREVRVIWGEACELSGEAVYEAREAKSQPHATQAQVDQALAELRQHDVAKLTAAKARRALDGMGLPGDAAAKAFRVLLEERRAKAGKLFGMRPPDEKDD